MTKVQIGTKQYDLQSGLTDESSFWKTVFEFIYKNTVPDTTVIVRLDTGETAVFETDERGILSETENDIYLKESLYEVKKLRKIDPETEQHLFWDIVPNNMGDITIDVGGRFGQTGGTNVAADLVEGAYVEHAYDSRLYWAKYYSLLFKGFTDYTDELYDKEEDIAKLEAQFSPEDEPEGEALSLENIMNEFLIGAARQVLTDELDIQWMSSEPPFGKRQTTSARKTQLLFDPNKSVKENNKLIVKLLGLCNVSFKEGRSKKKPSDFLICETGDPVKNAKLINDAASFWDNIVSSMESIVAAPEKEKNEAAEEEETASGKSPYGEITMKMATKEENERIRKLFNISSIYKSKVILVDDPIHRDRYERYVKEHGISVEKELIHGSALGNWNSLIMNSVVLDVKKLNPNVTEHGKALGHGAYFAMDFAKSNNYVGMASSVHHYGNATVAIIGKFRTAYGNPMYAVPNQYGSYYDVEFPKSGKDCIHAEKTATGWVMDEVVFFNEAAYYLEELIVYSTDENELSFLPEMPDKE